MRWPAGEHHTASSSLAETSNSTGTISSAEDAVAMWAATVERYRRRPVPRVDHTQGLKKPVLHYVDYPAAEHPLFWALPIVIYYGFEAAKLHANALDMNWGQSAPQGEEAPSTARPQPATSARQPAPAPTTSFASPTTPSHAPKRKYSHPSTAMDTQATAPKRARNGADRDSARSSNKPQDPSSPKTGRSNKHPLNKQEKSLFYGKNSSPKSRKVPKVKSVARQMHSKRGSQMNAFRKDIAHGIDVQFAPSIDVDTAPAAKGGWQGTRAIVRSIGDTIRSLWKTSNLGSHLKNFVPIPFKNV